MSLKLQASQLRMRLFISFFEKLVQSRLFKKGLIAKLERELYEAMVENVTNHPRNVRIRTYQMVVAMLNTAAENFRRGFISKRFAQLAFDFVRGGLIGSKSLDTSRAYEEKYGEEPPGFLVLSPTKRCNLNCTGCYAGSTAKTAATLPYELVERITRESHDLFGNRFMTISGGEPFLYNDQGKTLFDLWEKFQDVAFLVYTNGTLITEEVAQRLGKAGNVTPALSVEGFQEETDARRGRGTFKKVLRAMKYLREAQVPIGLSVTAIKDNTDLLLKDDFYDFFFEEQRISHMWMFHLMPIGRAKDVMDLAPTAEQRVGLFRKWEKALREKKWFIADFWNSGMVVDGCIAYARHYFYINWDGNIMPCVFIPYYVDNIFDIYKKGGNLLDAISSDFFKRGRKWQRDYGLSHTERPDNWLMPCSIRDHYKIFRNEILVKDAKGENEIAKEVLESKEYFDFLDSFDQELHKLTEPIWQYEYLKK
jgi:MoaA/NifB/PqqE/SkfB family radical SAM enzyme